MFGSKLNYLLKFIKAVTSFWILLLGCLPLVVHSQAVNGYGRVTSIAGTVLNVSDINETNGTFEAGSFLVIMQMQDNVIGSVADNSTFGSLGTIQSAGLYEIIQITSLTESGGIPTSITLNRAPNNTYNTGANSRVQVISFPTLGSPNYTSTANITALDWNGQRGGVIAFRVDGVFTLEHNINANGVGFRGGNRDAGTAGGCDNTTFRSAATNRLAAKGESIYLSTSATYAEGKGRILNGGGGGNEHNGGGGGGGNFTAGGAGGLGYNCTSPASAGGLGGLSLAGQIAGNRVFMGGGGGGGQGNNNVSTDGSDGGGIILIVAEEIRTTGTCGDRNIRANGDNAAQAGNDGGGGGGAGGSIVLQVNTWNIIAACDLIIGVNGGDGGRSNTGAVHGGGGGGGQGVVVFTGAEPTTNVTRQNQNGVGGCNNSSSPCNSQASNGTGTNNTGVIVGTATPLPIELISFDAYRNANNEVELSWKTASEINCDFYLLNRSTNLHDWETIGLVHGAGNSNRVLSYSFTDIDVPNQDFYYQLIQVDYNGDRYEEGVRFVEAEYQTQYTSDELMAYPNPISRGDLLKIEFPQGMLENAVVTVLDLKGKVVYSEMATSSNESNKIGLRISEDLKPGFYMVSVTTAGSSSFLKLMVQ